MLMAKSLDTQEEKSIHSTELNWGFKALKIILCLVQPFPK